MDKYNEDLIVFQGIEQEENKIIERNRLNNYIPSSCKNPPRYRKDDDFGPPPQLISVRGGKKSKKSTKSTKSTKSKKIKKSNKTKKSKKSNKTKKTKKSKK